MQTGEFLKVYLSSILGDQLSMVYMSNYLYVTNALRGKRIQLAKEYMSNYLYEQQILCVEKTYNSPKHFECQSHLLHLMCIK